MRRWTPSIAPNRDDQNIYLVEDCFDRQGCVWREADAERTDLETVISDLMSGQYNNPLRVIAFNTAEHWSEDVSAEAALEIERRADLSNREISRALEDFFKRHAGLNRQLALRLA
jgi:hypothetical protein